jgi:hypothetical protein
MANRLASDLALEILGALQREFEDKHLSQNLLNNTQIVETKDYVEIHINAPTYDFYEYFIHGLIIPPKKAGLPTEYASTLDAQGSQYTMYWVDAKGNVKKAVKKPRNHVGYVNKILSEGINNWTNKQGLDIKVEQ